MDAVVSRPEPLEWHSIEELCDRCLGGQPSPGILQVLKPLAQERPEVRDFVRRALQLTGISGLGPENLSPFFAMGLAVSAGILPGAWGGMVPPITRAGRHQAIDEYLAHTRWHRFGTGTVMLEVGCGFPPQTAVDASARFPDWRVIGADPVFDQYLYEDDDMYACCSADGHVRYFSRQPNADMSVWVRLYADRAATTRRVSALFEQLVATLPFPDDGEMSVAAAGGSRLTRWPLKRWESANLRFVQAGIGSGDVPAVDLIRCFNVLMYYDAQFRLQFEAWAASKLHDGGLAVTGLNAPNHAEAHYEVYRKEGIALVEKEFAFSIDNVRTLSIMPWFSMHDDQPGAIRLAHAMRIIRSDEQFREEFDARVDDLLSANGLMVRDAGGYLAWAADSSLAAIAADNSALSAQLDREGFTEGACDVLRRAGFTAWRNEAGHVAVDPARFADLGI